MTESEVQAFDANFRGIFESEFSYVCRSLRRCGIRDRDVDDLAHDVFLAMHLRFGDFDRTRPIKPWLFGITFRVASHHRRRPGYQREGLDDGIDTERRDHAPLADEQLDDHRKRAMVLQLLDTLDLDRRAVLIMHDLDELPMKEVAEALGIPVFTAYSRLRVAREEFAAAAKRAQLQGARA